MATSIEKELAKLQQMTVNHLQDTFTEVFGESPRGRNKQWLVKRIAWRLQANREGGLSERARRRAMELADFSDLRLTAPSSTNQLESADLPSEVVPSQTNDPRLPAPGSILTRTYKGQQLQVEVLRDGFLYAGERYQSLSAVARAITGSRWNGFLFFGLAKREKTS